MKAVRVNRFGGPEVLTVRDADEPSPGSGEILVRVLAAGVNPVDTYIRSGAYVELPDLPYTPGGDAGGLVAAVGPAAAGGPAEDASRDRDGGALKETARRRRVPAIGERVYTSGSLSGTYAELALCRAGQLHPLPAGLTFGQGAAIGVPYTTAYRALFQRAQANAGETVLVHGASGAVGLAAVQLAVAEGLTVLATAGSDKGRALALEQGAAAVFDHRDDGHFEQLRDWTGGRGVDLVVELLANVNLDRDLLLLAQRGRVVVVGSRGRVALDPRDLMDREGSILAMRLPNARADELSAAHAAVQAGLEAGRLRPVVGRELPLAEAAAAHRAVIDGPALGKLVLIP